MSQKIGPVKRAFGSPRGLKFAMNIWPPLLFSGIRILEIGPNFSHVHLRLAKSHLTSNYFGTQYGGSLFSMTDAFWVIMIAQNLGPAYTVWDKRAEIEFIAPGRTKVTAKLRLEPSVLAEIKECADRGEKVLRWFDTDLLNNSGDVVATVRKQVFVRLKPTG